MVRPRKGALAHASVPTKAGGDRAKNAKSCEREQRRRGTTRPARSLPTTGKSRLPMPKPTTAMPARSPLLPPGGSTMPTRSESTIGEGRAIPLLVKILARAGAGHAAGPGRAGGWC